MYGWVWRHLPGGRVAKSAQALVLIGAIATLLWYVVFPWLASRLPIDRIGPG